MSPHPTAPPRDSVREPVATVVRLTNCDRSTADTLVALVVKQTRRRLIGPLIVAVAFGLFIWVVTFVLLTMITIGIFWTGSGEFVSVLLLIVFVVGVVAGVASGVWLYQRLRESQCRTEIIARLSERSCFGCGYRLRGIAPDAGGQCRCPECGVGSPIMLDGGMVMGDADRALLAAARGESERRGRSALNRVPANPEPAESLLALTTARPDDVDDLTLGLVRRFPGFGTLPFLAAAVYAVCGAVLVFGGVMGVAALLRWVLGLVGVVVAPGAWAGTLAMAGAGIAAPLVLAWFLQRGVSSAWRQVVLRVLADDTCFTCGVPIDHQVSARDGRLPCTSCGALNPVRVASDGVGRSSGSADAPDDVD